MAVGRLVGLSGSWMDLAKRRVCWVKSEEGLGLPNPRPPGDSGARSAQNTAVSLGLEQTGRQEAGLACWAEPHLPGQRGLSVVT